MMYAPEDPSSGASAEVVMCNSCDRCRSRKQRCDGQSPCQACINKYMKTNKINSIEGVPLEAFECFYSPAKRRGPVPGKTQNRKSKIPAHAAAAQQRQVLQAEQQAALATEQAAWPAPASTTSSGGRRLKTAHPMEISSSEDQEQHAARRVRTERTAAGKTPDTVQAHLHLLSQKSGEGNRLRAYFRLSIDELFTLPPIPSDEDFCVAVGLRSVTLMNNAQKHALLASRFCEVALGALVHNEIVLSMELCNAVVHCLRECADSAAANSHPVYLFEVSRAYFLLGTFRAFRGDMERYFKYRRVSITHLSQSEEAKHEMLMAAMSFLDSWAYMIYNANESELPEIDGQVPMPAATADASQFACIMTDPKNRMWIQGAPPVYLNNEAPLPARSLDALACAVRQCCDQANNRFAEINKETNNDAAAIPEDTILTPTKTAVLANEDELCSRNMVLSAFTLLQQYEASSSSAEKNQGHHLIISAMDAFLENGDEDGSAGFTDSQIQSLLSVCNIVIENPYLLYHAGPTYHMVSNAAVLICHLLNGMHATHYGSASHPNSEMESAVFDEILDTFLSVRKLLNAHRRKLPVKLRCHGIPRPSLLQSTLSTSTNGNGGEQPFIDLGNTLMCACRGCQGFVLMACSPCVAAERAQAAARKQQMEMAQENLELDQDLFDFGSEFDLDDDALLGMLSRMIT